MTVSLSNIAGTAQTGFTTPGYNVTADTVPADMVGKQWAITGLTGTQAGVTAHSVASPFTITFTRPKNLRVLAAVDPVTGQLRGVARNTYGVMCRKGAVPLLGQAPVVALFKLNAEIPAGTDSASPSEIRAGASAIIGALSQVSSGWGDTLVSGIL